jgi:hypothetical protein
MIKTTVRTSDAAAALSPDHLEGVAGGFLDWNVSEEEKQRYVEERRQIADVATLGIGRAHLPASGEPST